MPALACGAATGRTGTDERFLSQSHGLVSLTPCLQPHFPAAPAAALTRPLLCPGRVCACDNVNYYVDYCADNIRSVTDVLAVGLHNQVVLWNAADQSVMQLMECKAQVRRARWRAAATSADRRRRCVRLCVDVRVWCGACA